LRGTAIRLRCLPQQVEPRRGNYLRGYLVDFIAKVCPRWTQDATRRPLAAAR
jgi:hypothetical protein